MASSHPPSLFGTILSNLFKLIFNKKVLIIIVAPIVLTLCYYFLIPFLADINWDFVSSKLFRTILASIIVLLALGALIWHYGLETMYEFLTDKLLKKIFSKKGLLVLGLLAATGLFYFFLLPILSSINWKAIFSEKISVIIAGILFLSAVIVIMWAGGFQLLYNLFSWKKILVFSAIIILILTSVFIFRHSNYLQSKAKISWAESTETFNQENARHAQEVDELANQVKSLEKKVRDLKADIAELKNPPVPTGSPVKTTAAPASTEEVTQLKTKVENLENDLQRLKAKRNEPRRIFKVNPPSNSTAIIGAPTSGSQTDQIIPGPKAPPSEQIGQIIPGPKAPGGQANQIILGPKAP